MDPEYEEGVKRATKHDVFATYSHLINRPQTKLLVNGGFDAEEAEGIIKRGEADAVVFGVPCEFGKKSESESRGRTAEPVEGKEVLIIRVSALDRDRESGSATETTAWIGIERSQPKS